MGLIKIEVWLYGPLSRYASAGNASSHARVVLDMEPGARVSDLLAHFALPLSEKGISFINGQLTDMPGMGADLDRVLSDGDRVAFFHRKSMWPFQYRFGASASAELSAALKQSGGELVHLPRQSRDGDAADSDADSASETGQVTTGEGGACPDGPG